MYIQKIPLQNIHFQKYTTRDYTTNDLINFFSDIFSIVKKNLQIFNNFLLSLLRRKKLNIQKIINSIKFYKIEG